MRFVLAGVRVVAIIRTATIRLDGISRLVNYFVILHHVRRRAIRMARMVFRGIRDTAGASRCQIPTVLLPGDLRYPENNANADHNAKN